MSESQIEIHKQFSETGLPRIPEFRLQALHRLSRFLRVERDALIRALSKDMSKPSIEAYTGEIAPVEAEIRTARRRIRKWMKPKTVATPLLNAPAGSRHYPCPYGTVFIIGPWNYPVGLVLQPLVAALAAGNCAMIKPSEQAPETASFLQRRLPEYLDPRHVSCVTGGATVVRKCIESGPDMVFFTGGSEVGRKVGEQCARNWIPSVQELGGCNPCIIDSSADLPETARRVAWGKFFDAGQTCVAPNHCFVHERVYDTVVQEIKRTVTRFYGPDPARSPDFGRICTEKQFDTLVDRLKSQSRKPTMGGEYNKEDRYVAPTLIQVSEYDNPLLTSEIFGPILPIVRYRSLGQVLSAIRRAPPPLAAYLFSRSETSIRAVRDATKSGSLCINGTMHLIQSTELPFGGIGKSGMGRYHGKAGFDAFSFRRSELHKHPRFGFPLLYPPYRAPTAVVRRALEWVLWR